MKRAYLAVLLLALIVLAFVAGRQFSDHNGSAHASSRRVLYYVDPMHPAYKSDKPGIAPDCGMQLEPVYADSETAGGTSSGRDTPIPSGEIQITPERQQLIGVRSEPVADSSGKMMLRTVGRVTPHENLVYRITAWTDGWIRTIEQGATGSLVAKDQVLATMYTREFLTAQQAYFYALNSSDRSRQEEDANPEQGDVSNAQVRASEDNLRILGMSDTQIHEIAKTRKPTRDIAIRSPVAGVVLSRNVFPSVRFERGEELYRVADLSRVWIMADLFEYEAQQFRPGTIARITLPHQGRSFSARVTDDPPLFDPATRTLKLRLETDNPGFLLRPEMFVDVELPLNLPRGLSVPVDAVLDSGLRQRVFVDRGNGFFETREVETGWRQEDRVQIVRGLKTGERVVVSGSFLIDSESRMKAAAAGASSNAPGMLPDAAKREPAPELRRAAAPAASSKDPSCGMRVDRAAAAAAGNTLDYHGTTYYFCSKSCKENFSKNPDRYLASSHGGENHD